jgi:hypothetical protein
MVEATALNNMQSRSSSMLSPPNKISSKSTNRFKSNKGFLCTHLGSLNDRHFGIAEATRLKIWHLRHIHWHHLPTNFHEITHIGSKVISGGLRHARAHTHTHTHTHRLVIWWAYFHFGGVG